MSDAKKIWYDDKLLDAKGFDMRTNRAFRYGDGLIETIRLMRGELLFFHDHIDRMFSGLQALMMPTLSIWTAKFFFDCIEQVLLANGIDANARIRIQLWREGEGLYAPTQTQTHFIVEATSLESEYVFDDNGASLGISTYVRKIYDRLANVKTSSALMYVMAALEAKRNGVDAMLVMNERNTAADAPGKNIFVIEQGRVVTPSLTDACVAGVLRHQLLELLRGHNIVAAEESLTAERIANADEIFLTNVVDGIQPVTKFRDKTYSTHQSKQLHNLLMNHLLHTH